MSLESIAWKLIQAEKDVKPIKPVIEMMSGIGVNEAYEIQLKVVSKKVEEEKKIIGKKIGLTSSGMQDLMGVNEPDYGHLLNDMMLQNGSRVERGKLIYPRVEGEIAFILKKDLQGPGVSIVDVYQATEGIMPAIEIVDSRIVDWKIKLEDTVADNASSALFVLGDQMHDVKGFDLLNIGMYITKNGKVANSGAGIEVLGNPVASIAWLANKLSQFGISLKAGEIILSGAITAALNAERHDMFCVHFDRLGAVSVSFI